MFFLVELFIKTHFIFFKILHNAMKKMYWSYLQIDQTHSDKIRYRFSIKINIIILKFEYKQWN